MMLDRNTTARAAQRLGAAMADASRLLGDEDYQLVSADALRELHARDRRRAYAAPSFDGDAIFTAEGMRRMTALLRRAIVEADADNRWTIEGQA